MEFTKPLLQNNKKNMILPSEILMNKNKQGFPAFSNNLFNSIHREYDKKTNFWLKENKNLYKKYNMELDKYINFNSDKNFDKGFLWRCWIVSTWMDLNKLI